MSGRDVLWERVYASLPEPLARALLDADLDVLERGSGSDFEGFLVFFLVFSPCFSPCLFRRVSYAALLVWALFGTHTTWHRFCVLRLPVPKCPHQCHRGESGHGVRRITSTVS